MEEAERLVAELIEERKVTVGRSTDTGILSLDMALGGGLSGGVVELYGDASTGKTSLLYRIFAQAQRDSYETVLCSSEYLDLAYARNLGVDLDRLFLFSRNTAEHVFVDSLEFLNNQPRIVLAIDSATAFRPTDDSPGRWGQLVEYFLSMLPHSLCGSSCVVMVNQVRMPPGLDPDRSKFFANTPDSAARKIASHFSARLELSRSEVSEDRYQMVVNVVKNTLARPGVVVELPFVKGKGVDRELDYVRAWLQAKSGGWYELDGQMIHGEAAAAEYLRENREDFENRIKCSARL
jgi:recombination protein RecA